jgi:hypothetical protein
MLFLLETLLLNRIYNILDFESSFNINMNLYVDQCYFFYLWAKKGQIKCLTVKSKTLFDDVYI